MNKRISLVIVILFLLCVVWLNRTFFTVVCPATYYHLKGDFLHDRGKFESAIKNLSKSIKLNPKYTIPYKRRASIYKKIGKYDESLKDLDVVIKLNPYSLESFIKRGNIYLDKGEFNSAIDNFQSARKIDPEYADAYWGMGLAQYYKGEFDQAISEYYEAIKLDPKKKNGKIYCNLAAAWVGKKKYKEAIAEYTTAIDLDPILGDAYIGRGTTYSYIEEFDRAIKDYSKVIELNPQNANAFYLRGEIWRTKQEYEKAISDFNKVREIDPDHYLMYNSLAWIMATCPNEKFRNGDEALKFARKAVEIESNWFTLDTLASAYAEVGQFDKAIQVIEKAISQLKDPKEISEMKDRAKYFRDSKPWRE